MRFRSSDLLSHCQAEDRVDPCICQIYDGTWNGIGDFGQSGSRPSHAAIVELRGSASYMSGVGSRCVA